MEQNKNTAKKKKKDEKFKKVKISENDLKKRKTTKQKLHSFHKVNQIPTINYNEKRKSKTIKKNKKIKNGKKRKILLKNTFFFFKLGLLQRTRNP